MALSALHSDLTAELCNLLQKACRAVRFYPAEHPTAAEAVDGLVRAFAGRLDYYPMLHLSVKEDSLLEDGELVYLQPVMRDNLAFLLFRDGIRDLSFHQGLTRYEVETLVLALAGAQDGSEAGADLAGALWELDLAHVSYTLVDPLLEGEHREQSCAALLAQLESSWNTTPETVEEAFTPQLEPRTLLEGHLKSGKPGDPVLAGSLLAPEDLEAIEQVVGDDEDDDVVDDFAVVLCEVLSSARSKSEVVAAGRALQELLDSFLQWGEIGRLCDCIERLLELGTDHGGPGPDVEAILRPLSRGEGIRRLIFSVDSPQTPSAEHVERLLTLLTPHSYPAMVECLVASPGKASRKCLLNALSSGQGVPLNLLAPYLGDARWYVVRNMVYLLGRHKDPTALEHLKMALRHADERVRREAVRSLSASGWGGSAPLVLGCLDDPASSVRAAAARHAPSLAGVDVTAALLRHVTARDFHSRPTSEATSLLEALGRQGDDRGVPALESIWRGRGLLRTRPLELRLQALTALGLIGSETAQRSLNAAASSSEQAISEQAAKTLKRLGGSRWPS